MECEVCFGNGYIDGGSDQGDSWTCIDCNGTGVREAWVILNANLLQWGDEFYETEAAANKELRDFFRGVSGVNFSKFHVLSVDNLPEGAKLKTSKQTT
jgi:hypothetical protein